MAVSAQRDERILIIDDQSLTQSYLRYALEELGYRNTTFTDQAQTALTLCQQNRYDLIICSFNLQQGKDGYQLYEELKARNLQSPACGFVFISSETSPALVYSVIELQPDEFLAKPFVIRDLQQRISRLLHRKHQLRPVYYLLGNKQLPEALQKTDQMLAQPELHKLFPFLLKLKGDILLEQQQYHSAEHFFKAMLSLQPFTWAKIGLVRCYMQLQREAEAFAELEKLLIRSESRLFALDCLAELEFKQQRYQQAQHHLLAAADLSPRNLLRQQRLLQLSRLNHDYEIQYRAARDMVKFSRYSMYEQPELYLNLARASIDYALSVEDSDHSQRLEKQANLSLASARRQFPQQQQEPLQVLQARLLYLQDHKDKAQQLLATLEQNEPLQSLEDALDKAKALHEVGLADASRKLFRQISDYCQQQQTEPVFSCYLQQEQQERDLMSQGPRELNNSAVHLYQYGNWQEAFNAFIQAHKVMPKNAGIALNLWQTLLTSPKTLCTDEQQQQLLEQCQQIIDSSKLKPEQQERYQQLKQKYLSQLA